MRKKIKLIGNIGLQQVQKEVNEFIETIDDRNIVSITHNDSQGETGYWCSVLIVYYGK